jgi:hypothetical protein
VGLSEWEAYNRIEVARVARRFPLVLSMLAEGSIHLTAVKRLGPHLTPGNHQDVLESARGKTKVEVQEIVATLAPRPDVPSSVRRLPPSLELPGPTRNDARSRPMPTTMGADVGGTPALVSRDTSGRDRAAEAITPLSPDRYKLQVTIGAETLERLRLVKDMLGHAVPSGDDATVLDRALRALLAELAKKKFGGTCARRSPARRSENENRVSWS